MITDFSITCDINHYDTTSVSTYGDCDNGKTGQSIKITFGHSKKHRNDLKQLIWSMAVSSDSGFPLFQKAYSGNTADVTTYVEQWHNLIDLLDRRDFLFVGDCKLATHENMVHIHDNEGYFISPAPMYESYKNFFHRAVSDHDREVLLTYKGKLNRGFEVPLAIDHEDKMYHFRMVIIFDHGLFKQKRTTLENRVRKTKEAFSELSKKLNAYKLKTREAIEKACLAILKKYHTTEFFSFNIENEPVTTYKHAQKGRPARGAKKIAVTEDHFTVMHTFNKKAFDQAVSQCGYYTLITNKTEESLSIYAAMMAYKNQYKSEHTNRRVKSSYNIEPIYLHTPERIEAFLFLFKIALQVIVLIERNARKNIKARNKGLDNFMPNRKDVRNPRTENLLTEFQYVVSGEVPMPDGNHYGFVSQLTDIQKDILTVLEVPFECFSYDYMFNTG
jgi:transposase